VGVFVDAAESEIRRIANSAGLSAVQLHGRETPALVADLRRAGLRVIKVLFTDRLPRLAEADRYAADSFLVEPGRGPLPGGSGAAWPWAVPAEWNRATPVILAGGLDAGNVREAILSVAPDAVDVSSGVESAPGRKDLDRVRAFVEAVRACPTPGIGRRIF
jgi:phosphoribosylanthranilate isomerase